MPTPRAFATDISWRQPWTFQAAAGSMHTQLTQVTLQTTSNREADRLMILFLSHRRSDRDSPQPKLSRPALGIFAIPIDRPLEAIVPRKAWFPAEHAIYL